MKRRHLLPLFAGAPLALAGTRAAAQAAPVRVLVGFAPGGGVDALTRLTGDAIQAATGRPVVVENRTGAAGRLAVEAVKTAPADGNTLLVAPQGPMTLFPHIFRNLRFDPSTDFAPITRLASGDFALTIGPLVPARDLAGFQAWLKTAGEKANYGSPGAGTVPHFVGVSIARALGTPMTHVPYRGAAPAMTDVAGGAIAAAVTPLAEALELHKAGRVRIVATAGATRSPFADGVPTLKELGIDVDVPFWYGLYAPAATPPAAIERLHAAVHAGLTTAAAKEKLSRLGLVAALGSAAELRALQKRESEMWAPLVKASGFTPED